MSVQPSPAQPSPAQPSPAEPLSPEAPTVGELPVVLAAVSARRQPLEALAAAAARPVHAYLLVGQAGTGVDEAATAFAAALLCPAGGDRSCDTCRRVLAGVHPDVTQVEREGAAISIDTAREVARLAARSPAESERQVLILHDFHLVREAGPALLKTIEEPPGSTVFVVLAEYIPPELVTIASRCVGVEFPPLSLGQVVEALVGDGIDPGSATELASLAGGRLDRARLLASDPASLERLRAWSSIPGRLDGFGATAAALADELVAHLDAGSETLRTRHQAEASALEERNARAAEVNGKVGRAGRDLLKAGVKELEERQRRELRRVRTDDLRAGLAALAGVYRDRLAAAAGQPDQAVRSRQTLRCLDLIQTTATGLDRNPSELLALQALLARLGQVAAG